MKQLTTFFTQKWLDSATFRVIMQSLSDIAARVKSDLDTLEADDDADYGYSDFGTFLFDYWDEDGYSQRMLVPLSFISAKEIREVQMFAQEYECVYMAKMCLELQSARQALYIERRDRLKRRYKIFKWTLIAVGLALPYTLVKVFA